jgi:hypothetical protein
MARQKWQGRNCKVEMNKTHQKINNLKYGLKFGIGLRFKG